MTTRDPETCTCENHKECIDCVHYEDCSPHGGAASIAVVVLGTLISVLAAMFLLAVFSWLLT